MKSSTKALAKYSSLAAGVLLLGAGSAYAQNACFDCVDQGNVGDNASWSCTGGDVFGSCHTDSHVDPNTCAEYFSCVTTMCMNDCNSSVCDPNMIWDINNSFDYLDFGCYRYNWGCS